jgi:ABC-type dipeptide/oligopeptide/nickel transport system permease component
LEEEISMKRVFRLILPVIVAIGILIIFLSIQFINTYEPIDQDRLNNPIYKVLMSYYQLDEPVLTKYFNHIRIYLLFDFGPSLTSRTLSAFELNIEAFRINLVSNFLSIPFICLILYFGVKLKAKKNLRILLMILNLIVGVALYLTSYSDIKLLISIISLIFLILLLIIDNSTAITLSISSFIALNGLNEIIMKFGLNNLEKTIVKFTLNRDYSAFYCGKYLSFFTIVVSSLIIYYIFTLFYMRKRISLTTAST